MNKEITQQLTHSAVKVGMGKCYLLKDGGFLYTSGFELNNLWAVEMLARLLKENVVAEVQHNKYINTNVNSLVFGFKKGNISARVRVSGHSYI